MAKNECPHNPGVNCPEKDRRCPLCGWSPEGAKRRQSPSLATSPPPEELPPRHKGGKPRQVAKTNEAGEVLEIYPSLVIAADANRMTPTSVKYHCQGKLKKPFKCTGGFSFRYAD